MATFVAVHGAWCGGWVWQQLATAVEQKGHTFVAPDLPHPSRSNQPSFEQPITLSHYADAIGSLLDQFAEPVYLIGHSMGGAVISLVSEQRPEKVAGLIYITAMLLRDGQCLFDDQGPKEEKQEKSVKLFEATDDKQFFKVPSDDAIKQLFLGASKEIIEQAKQKLIPQPIAPFAEKITLTEQRHGQIPKTYIHCLKDQIVSSTTQQYMISKSNCTQVFELEASHMAPSTHPDEIAEILSSLVT